MHSRSIRSTARPPGRRVKSLQGCDARTGAPRTFVRKIAKLNTKSPLSLGRGNLISGLKEHATGLGNLAHFRIIPENFFGRLWFSRGGGQKSATSRSPDRCLSHAQIFFVQGKFQECCGGNSRIVSTTAASARGICFRSSRTPGGGGGRSKVCDLHRRTGGQGQKKRRSYCAKTFFSNRAST
jgi:hypothetical protein